jgi:hypothetical protein
MGANWSTKLKIEGSNLEIPPLGRDPTHFKSVWYHDFPGQKFVLKKKKTVESIMFGSVFKKIAISKREKK